MASHLTPQNSVDHSAASNIPSNSTNQAGPNGRNSPSLSNFTGALSKRFTGSFKTVSQVSLLKMSVSVEMVICKRKLSHSKKMKKNSIRLSVVGDLVELG